MYLGVPQLIYISLLLVGMGLEIANHGQSKLRTYNIWTTLIADGIVLWILIAGGFFSK